MSTKRRDAGAGRRARRALPLALVSLAACGHPLRPAVAPTPPAAFLLAPGEHFEIELASEAAEPLRWELRRPEEETVVRLVGRRMERREAVAREVWRFEAVAPGAEVVEIRGWREGQPGAGPARLVAYAVSVVPPGEREEGAAGRRAGAGPTAFER